MRFNLGKVLAVFLLAVSMWSSAVANTEFKGTETVNINKADAATFAAYLKGVATNKAKAIVQYRKANGRFKTIDDLKNVPGIGKETFKDMKRNVSTSRGKSAAPEGFKMGASSGKTVTKKKKPKSESSAKSKTRTGSDKRGSSSSDSASGKKRTASAGSGSKNKGTGKPVSRKDKIKDKLKDKTNKKKKVKKIKAKKTKAKKTSKKAKDSKKK